MQDFNLGQRIKEYLQKNNITQKRLCQILCCDDAKVSRLLNKESNKMSAITYGKICKGLGLSFDYFLKEE